jgi:hypothetical protein
MYQLKLLSQYRLPEGNSVNLSVCLDSCPLI